VGAGHLRGKVQGGIKNKGIALEYKNGTKYAESLRKGGYPRKNGGGGGGKKGKKDWWKVSGTSKKAVALFEKKKGPVKRKP